eukprot:CAMPEP_0115045380 /NCGR_PEP_ID=MMETSP0216-20121206/48120_1 /TAXON_ID=223996 /ORGANISM="Protocruzia adherens, Strain Boccale" /LENGTH=236 /DNA_ID=CAMNT_0002428261 /DNA_START=45 /DNA_END=755 /DNA_ORIENTATION=+
MWGKKTKSTTSAASKSKTGTSTRSTTRKKSGAAATQTLEAKITKTYKSIETTLEEGGKGIDAEGISAMFTEAGVDPYSDVAVLAFLWKCETEKYGIITEAEFTRGMSYFGVSDINGLGSKIKKIRDCVKDPHADSFREFHNFVFQISREGTFKQIESKLACALLNLILGSHFSLIEKFEEFMTAKDKPNVNHDQWSNLLEVLKLIGDDAEKYEDDGACKSAMHGSASVRNIEPREV